MDRKLSLLAISLVLAVGLVVFNAYGKDVTGSDTRRDTVMASRDMAMGFEQARLSSSLVGSSVKDVNGDSLGRISDLVVDDGGRVSFAIVSHGGLLGIGETKTAVPFEAFRFDPDRKDLTLDVSKDKFASAPAFDEAMLKNRDAAEKVYTYFGLQPYWGEAGSNSYREGQMTAPYHDEGSMKEMKPSSPSSDMDGTAK